MKKNWFTWSLVIIALMFLLVGCGGNSEPAANTTEPGTAAQTETSDSDGETYILKAGHTCTPEHPYQTGLEYFRDLLAERTNGKVILEIYPSGQLGNETDLLEGEQLGTVDIAVTASAPVVNFSNALAVLDMPYLFENKQHAFAVLDGEIGDSFWKDLEPIGIKGLAFFDNGFMYVHDNSGFVLKPDDMKGMKIRTMENALHKAFVNATGATATPMAMGEVFTALQNNTVQGSVNSTITIYTSKWYTVAEYITHTDHIYATAPMTMSQKSFDKLPPEYQKILLECAKEAKVKEREAVAAIEKSAEADMISQGCSISYDADKEAYKKMAYEKVWPQFVGKTIDQALIDKIQALAE